MTCNGDCNQGRECDCECKMTTKDEALRMAIEALEEAQDIIEGKVGQGGYFHKPIQTCKEALAETQEPMIIKQENGMVLKLGYDELPNGTAFYTTPPSREWQCLSYEEILRLEGLDCVDEEYIKRFVRAIEAKLR
ncbi:hypothetical protein UFOVP774_54, partial [uncultured Caudovirales phage]